MVFVGIDIGSTTTKVAILDEEGKLLSSSIVLTGFAPEDAANRCLKQCLDEAGYSQDDIDYSIATGYGRELLEFVDGQVTEIGCHGKGINYYFPEARGVIDIGGQDSKAISIDEAGRIITFAMNDRCAAGTGRFLDVMAGIMGLSVNEMGKRSLEATEALPISSICTVFAESEVISQISKKGTNPVNVMAGIHSAVARRVYLLVKKARLTAPIAMSGGVAKNLGVVKAFEELLETKLLIAPEPQIIGALGAAVTAKERGLKQHINQIVE